MSATRTFTPMTANTDLVTITAYTNATKFGYQDAEWARQDLDVLSYLCGHLPLGGDENSGILSASYTPVNQSMRYTLNGDTVGGMTVDACVSYYTSDAATSVTVRIRNLTDSSTAATGTTSTSTTRVDETLSVTLASGAKSYELQVIGGNATNPIFAWGYFRIRRVPA